jgi:hypothetical protein
MITDVNNEDPLVLRAIGRCPFTDEETERIASQVYDHVWHQSAGGTQKAAGLLAVTTA